MSSDPQLETTLQRLNRCRSVLRMHGVLSDAENLRILQRIVGNYGEFLPDRESLTPTTEQS